MEEDVGQDTSPDKNITVAELGGPSSSSEAKIRQDLVSLLLESMRLSVKEVRKVVEMIIIKSRGKKFRKCRKKS